MEQQDGVDDRRTRARRIGRRPGWVVALTLGAVAALLAGCATTIGGTAVPAVTPVVSSSPPTTAGSSSLPPISLPSFSVPTSTPTTRTSAPTATSRPTTTRPTTSTRPAVTTTRPATTTPAGGVGTSPARPTDITACNLITAAAADSAIKKVNSLSGAPTAVVETQFPLFDTYLSPKPATIWDDCGYGYLFGNVFLAAYVLTGSTQAAFTEEWGSDPHFTAVSGLGVPAYQAQTKGNTKVTTQLVALVKSTTQVWLYLDADPAKAAAAPAEVKALLKAAVAKVPAHATIRRLMSSNACSSLGTAAVTAALGGKPAAFSRTITAADGSIECDYASTATIFMTDVYRGDSPQAPAESDMTSPVKVTGVGKSATWDKDDGELLVHQGDAVIDAWCVSAKIAAAPPAGCRAAVTRLIALLKLPA